MLTRHGMTLPLVMLTGHSVVRRDQACMRTQHGMTLLPLVMITGHSCGVHAVPKGLIGME